MNTNKISKLYIFNTYISLIPLVAICIGMSVWLVSKGTVNLFYPSFDLINLIVTFSFVGIIMNGINLKRKIDLWNILYFCISLILCVYCIFYIPPLRLPFGIYREPGVVSPLSELVFILFSIIVYWANFTEDKSLGVPFSIIYIIGILYLLWKEKLSKKLFLIIGRCIYLFFLFVDIFLIVIFLAFYHKGAG